MDIGKLRLTTLTGFLVPALLALVLVRSAAQVGQLPASGAVAKDEWSAAEIAVDKTECAGLDKTLALEFSYLPPIKQGACGTPQPIELRGFGANPHVSIEPPAVLNCQMAATLAHWFATIVQPAALRFLRSPVVSIRNAAAYDCRHRYGDPTARLSEHAKANAIDILSFNAVTGQGVSVAEHWGPTLRGLLQSQKVESVRKAKGQGEFNTILIVPTGKTQPDAGALAASTHLGSDAIRQARLDEALRRGIAVPKPATPEANFIHAVHDGACKFFGTVLGPEANDAHKDHLHLDLAARPGSSYCE